MYLLMLQIAANVTYMLSYCSVAISPDPRKPQLAIILTVEQSKKILLFDYEAQEAVGSIELPEAEGNSRNEHSHDQMSALFSHMYRRL